MDVLIDGHCHSVLADDDVDLGRWATEAAHSTLDGALGLALRRWCAPVVDLEPHVPVEVYAARRRELGAAEVNRRMLAAARLDTLLVDTGLDAPGLVPMSELARVREVVRLEHVAEHATGDWAEALHAATRGAVAVKSIAAYRCGLDLDPRRPTAAEVRRALAGRSGRLADPVLHRHLLWLAVDLGLPIQLHTGFGDSDVPLARADPALLQPWLVAVEPYGVPVVLLHCYPFHRQAGWLAQVFEHVYVDVGLTVAQTGTRATAVLGEFCELTPFDRLLFSTDAFGLAELYLVGAAQFRHSWRILVDGWLADGALSPADAAAIGDRVGAGNARRLYRLGQPDPPVGRVNE
ncbi:amidohydrolase [Longispora fulva]|uniref:Putative TIM-barrel fold metal-dependent hydrolase n=1 Tax=Longispora fulva TaxID=619741 RepID=A0A8J7GBR6_9ACTN|nr:amidohydrolase family protein [Longispora fulva]MBG6135500.1 putative TIM-barrel fold metal-dependent hydrolase [Longispora fulva]GIG56260.1 amidohydrolase [Longispora fulva]